MTRAALCGAAFLAAAQVALVAQAPDFSGTWKLDANRSRVTAAAGLTGLIAAGAPDILHVTQAANGTVIIESQINESHARVYKPGGRITTPVTVGQAGSLTMTSRWDSRTLVSEGRRESASGTITTVTELKEVLALGADRRTLTIEITTTAAGVTSASTLIYTKTQVVEPCQKWPTPCKK